MTIQNRIIQCGISKAFHNKQLKDGYTKQAYSNSFQPIAVTIEQLVTHITSGQAYTLSCFSSLRRTKGNFKQSQLLALDLDDNVSVQDCLNHAFVSENAFFIGATASSGQTDTDSNIVHKTRVLFLLDTVLTDIAEFERLQHTLQLHCSDLRPDPACKDATRLFYGSDHHDFVVLDNILSLSDMQDLADHYADIRQVEHCSQSENIRVRQYNQTALASIIDNTKRRYLSYARTTLANLVHELSTTLEGQRNEKLYKSGARMGNLVGANMIDRTEVEAELYNAGLQCGLSEKEIEQTLSHAINDGIETPQDLSQLDKTQANTQLQPVDLVTPTIEVNQRYINLKGAMGLTFVKSAMGTGKTESVKQWLLSLQQAERVCAITHNRKLIDNTTSRWSGFENYQAIDADDYRDMPKLIITPNSIHHLADVDGQLPQYDVVIIDEPYHVLSALNSHLFQSNQASRAWAIMSKLIRDTPHVLIMDAYLSQMVVDVFSALRWDEQSTQVIVNTYRVSKGQVNMHRNIGFCLQSAIQDAQQHDVLLVVACESNELCNAVTDILGDLWDKDSVLQVNGDNANSQATIDLMRDFNQFATQYKAVVHTSSISSGVSIEVPTVSCGLFDGSTTQGNSAGLVANDYAQMIGRTRDKRACHVYVEHRQHHLETSADVIYALQRRKALASRKTIATVIDASGNIQPANYQLLDIYARIEASKNTQANDPVRYTRAYLQHDGYAVVHATGVDKIMSDLIYGRKEQRQVAFKVLVLDPATPIVSNDDLRDKKMQRNGQPITPLIKAGNLKHKIQKIVGDVGITEQHYDDLGQDRQRATVYRFANLLTDDKTLARRDKHELNRPVHRQRHHLLNKRFNMAFLHYVFGTTELDAIGDVQLTKAELEQRMAQFVDYTLADELLCPVIESLRRDKQTCIGLARSLLNNLGLKLKSKQQRIAGTRIRMYWLNADMLQRQLSYATFLLTTQGGSRQSES